MYAIFGFTFHIGRMIVVRTPDIYGFTYHTCQVIWKYGKGLALQSCANMFWKTFFPHSLSSSPSPHQQCWLSWQHYLVQHKTNNFQHWYGGRGGRTVHISLRNSEKVHFPKIFAQDCSCQIEIHFSIKNTRFLFKYTLLCSLIYDRFIILFIKHNHKVSASFIKEKQRYKWLKTAKWISILLLVPGLLLTVRSASGFTPLKHTFFMTLIL